MKLVAALSSSHTVSATTSVSSCTIHPSTTANSNKSEGPKITSRQSLQARGASMCHKQTANNSAERAIGADGDPNQIQSNEPQSPQPHSTHSHSPTPPPQMAAESYSRENSKEKKTDASPSLTPSIPPVSNTTTKRSLPPSSVTTAVNSDTSGGSTCLEVCPFTSDPLVIRAGPNEQALIYLQISLPNTILTITVRRSMALGQSVRCSYWIQYGGTPSGLPWKKNIAFGFGKATVLSLDGGKSLQISTLKMLERLEVEVAKLLGVHIEIVDCFDMIAATGTGAIIALGLLSGRTVKELIAQWPSLIGPGHDTLQAELGHGFFDTYSACYCMIASRNLATMQPCVMRNYTIQPPTNWNEADEDDMSATAGRAVSPRFSHIDTDTAPDSLEAVTEGNSHDASDKKSQLVDQDGGSESSGSAKTLKGSPEPSCGVGQEVKDVSNGRIIDVDRVTNNEIRLPTPIPLWAAGWIAADCSTAKSGPTQTAFRNMGLEFKQQRQPSLAPTALNPSLMALEEAAMLEGKSLSLFVKEDLQLMVSMGSGQASLSRNPQAAKLSNGVEKRQSLNSMLSCQDVHREVQELFWYDDDVYYRFNVTGIADLPIDANKRERVNLIIKATLDYLTDEKFFDVKRVAIRLADRWRYHWGATLG
eukprot:GHVN01069155.1.p1 GENE.GHVN01069155.1~~GHVN01069155.1.p1  ORF type:complete len:647 (+),score=129.00 GHVN01069155.1:854-2794(+)